jgi:hypothetical protein
MNTVSSKILEGNLLCVKFCDKLLMNLVLIKNVPGSIPWEINYTKPPHDLYLQAWLEYCLKTHILQALLSQKLIHFHVNSSLNTGKFVNHTCYGITPSKYYGEIRV